jgi:hypothetical protein
LTCQQDGTFFAKVFGVALVERSHVIGVSCFMIFAKVDRILDRGIVERLVINFSGFTEKNALARFAFGDSKVGLAEQGGSGEK